MVRHGIKDFYTPVNPGEIIGVHCVDDRAYKMAGQAIQIAGGSFGLAQDVLAASYADGAGEDVFRMPIGATATIIDKNLAVRGYAAGTHKSCAAEQSAAAISRVICERADEVLPGAIEIARGDITDEEYEKIQKYYSRFTTDAAHYRGADVEAAHMDAHGVHRHELANEYHEASTMLVNHVEGSVFNAQAAYRNGVARYNYDAWAVHDLAEKVSGPFPVNPGKVAVAAAVRGSAIALSLPNRESETGVGVNLETVA